MTEHEIFSEFLQARGFGNIRVEGRVLDAAATFRKKRYAFSFSRSKERVDNPRRVAIEDETRTLTHGNFAYEVGYDFFIAVVFHPRDIFTMHALTREDLQNKNFFQEPVAYWRVRYLLDFMFFSKLWGKKEKGAVTKRGKPKSWVVVCNGLRFDKSKNDYIECFYRNSCVRYILWSQYEQSKNSGTLQKKFPDVYLRNIKPVFSMAKDFQCKYYKKPKQNGNK